MISYVYITGVEKTASTSRFSTAAFENATTSANIFVNYFSHPVQALSENFGLYQESFLAPVMSSSYTFGTTGNELGVLAEIVPTDVNNIRIILQNAGSNVIADVCITFFDEAGNYVSTIFSGLLSSTDVIINTATSYVPVKQVVEYMKNVSDYQSHDLVYRTAFVNSLQHPDTTVYLETLFAQRWEVDSLVEKGRHFVSGNITIGGVPYGNRFISVIMNAVSPNHAVVLCDHTGYFEVPVDVPGVYTVIAYSDNPSTTGATITVNKQTIKR